MPLKNLREREGKRQDLVEIKPREKEIKILLEYLPKQHYREEKKLKRLLWKTFKMK